MKKPTRARPLFAFVGSYTTLERQVGQRHQRISRRSPHRRVQPRPALGGLENPSFLAIDADGTRLYSVHGDRSESNAFPIVRHRPSGALNRQPTGGYNPVHLAFDATGGFLAVCNYGSDSLACSRLQRTAAFCPTGR